MHPNHNVWCLPSDPISDADIAQFEPFVQVLMKRTIKKVSRITYARLFSIIGTIYGVGDGSTTFKLPDCRSRISIGNGTGPSLSLRVLAAIGGAEFTTLAWDLLSRRL